MDIINFLQIDSKVGTSGQPKAEDFLEIANLGYETVINLALHSAENAIPNEGSIVSSTGMNYFHIPVIWDAPSDEKFNLFVNIMNYHCGHKIWVHCALNMRVSCFMYLYRSLIQGVSKDVAKEAMQQVWEPNTVWADFILQTERKG